MAQGQQLAPEMVRTLLDSYVELGTIAAAARKVDINWTTAANHIKRALEDEDFRKLCERIDTDRLERLEDQLIAASDAVIGRILVDDPTPQDLADIAVESGLKSFNYSNPKPQYLRGLVDLHKALVGRRRLQGELDGDISGGAALVIVESREPDEESPADGPPG